MVEVAHPSDTEPDRHDAIAGLTLNNPRGSEPNVSLAGWHGNWLLIHFLLPFPSAMTGIGYRADRATKSCGRAAD
jgi:hypothetical protein